MAKIKKFDLRGFCSTYNLDLRDTAKILKIKLPRLRIRNVSQAKALFLKTNDEREGNFAAKRWIDLATTYEEVEDFFNVYGTHNFDIDSEVYAAACEKDVELYFSKLKKLKNPADIWALYKTRDQAPDAEGELEIPTLRKLIEVSSSTEFLSPILNQLNNYEDHKEFTELYNATVVKLASCHGL